MMVEHGAFRATVICRKRRGMTDSSLVIRAGMCVGRGLPLAHSWDAFRDGEVRILTRMLWSRQRHRRIPSDPLPLVWILNCPRC